MRIQRQQELIQRLIDAGPRLVGMHGEASMVQRASAYTDDGRFHQEVDVLFERGPTFVALSSTCAQPGDYVTAQVGRVPVAVVRQDDGTLRAFVNACRHRGAPVFDSVVGSIGGRVSCGYHSWTYDRDGRLAARPLTDGAFDDVKLDCSLHPVVVAEAHGLIYVRAVGGRAIDVNELLGGAEDDLSSFGLESYVHVESRVNTWPVNWKLILDTFTESYHIRTLHKTTLAPYFLSDPSMFDAFGRNFVSIGLRNTVDREFSKPVAERSVVPYGTIQYFLVPSGLVVHQLDHFEVWRIEPVDVRTTRTVTSVYSPGDPAAARGRQHYLKNLDLLLKVTGAEDFSLMARIQANLDSGALPEVVYGRIEPALVYLHRSIENLLSTGAD